MSDLTRRKDRDRPNCRHIYFGEVHIGTIAKSNSIPNAEPKWQWLCGFHPGCEPGEQRGGTEATFEKAHEAFGVAWRVLSAPVPRRRSGLARPERLDRAETGHARRRPTARERWSRPVDLSH